VLSEQQESVLVKVIVGAIVLLFLGGLIWAVKNRSKAEPTSSVPAGCIENGFILPPIELYWQAVQPMGPESAPLDGFWEYDNDGKVALHVEFANGEKWHFVFVALCQNEDGEFYPFIEPQKLQ
jgi:hypothetical protein